MSQKEKNNGFIVFACKSSFLSNTEKRYHAVTGMTMGLPISLKSEGDVQSVMKEIEAYNVSEYQVFKNDQEVQVITYINTLISNLLEDNIVVKVEFTK